MTEEYLALTKETFARRLEQAESPSSDRYLAVSLDAIVTVLFDIRDLLGHIKERIPAD